MQGVLRLFGHQAIRVYRRGHVGRLDGDFYVGEVQILEYPDMPHRRLDQGLRGWMSVFLEQLLLKRAGVDPYPYGYFFLLGGPDHFGDLLGAAYVAGVYPEAVHAPVYRGQGEPVVEVYVRDE